MNEPHGKALFTRAPRRLLRTLEFALLMFRATPEQRVETLESLRHRVAARPEADREAVAAQSPSEDALVFFTRRLLDLDERQLAALERVFLDQREYEAVDFIAGYRTLSLDQRASFTAWTET